jgi:hypothetical protein
MPSEKHKARLVTLDAHPITPWTDSEIGDVLAAFGLGQRVDGPKSEASVSAIDYQRARCIVRTSSGAWFLKKHHPAAVRRESHAVVEAFRAAGGNAPRVVTLGSGGTWLDGTGYVAEAQELLPGVRIEHATDAQAVEAAEHTAILHRLPTGLVPEHLVGWYDRDLASDQWRDALANLDRLGVATEGLHDALPRDAKSAADATLLHSDLWRGNWLERGGGATALTDFDWVHRGDRLDDVADVVLAFCSDRDTRLDGDSVLPTGCDSPTGVDALDVKRLGAMMERYTMIAGALSGDEWRRLRDHIVSQWMRHALWHMQ